MSLNRIKFRFCDLRSLDGGDGVVVILTKNRLLACSRSLFNSTKEDKIKFASVLQGN
jgi:hypothetical protein